MAFVVAHAELVGDQTSDARAAPQRRREAVRLGAFEQQRDQALAPRGVEQRFASGAAGLQQPGRTVLAVLPPPLTDALPRDLEPPRRLRLITSLVEQPHGLETALLQRLEIPPSAFPTSHT